MFLYPINLVVFKKLNMKIMNVVTTYIHWGLDAKFT